MSNRKTSAFINSHQQILQLAAEIEDLRRQLAETKRQLEAAVNKIRV